jgi:ADP-ribosyl-[dinitrogen reductase] hydrolase
VLIEMAVADAYSIAFEFVNDPQAHGLVNDLASYQQHPKYASLKPSQYTDDTQRTIATGWTICSGDWVEPAAFLHNLVNEYRRSPRDGYSRRFQALIEEMKDKSSLDFIRAIKNRTDTNGSIMGCLPCGFLSNPADVRLAATMQAVATHSFKTVPHAQSLALAAHHFIQGGARADLETFLSEESQGPSTGYFPTRGGIEMTAEATSAAVLNLIGCSKFAPDHRSLSEVLRAAVDLGGDTDSVAALAVGLASLSDEFAKDLPQNLVDGLEFGNQAEHSDILALEDTLSMVARGE